LSEEEEQAEERAKLLARWRDWEDNWRMTVAAITDVLGGAKVLKRKVVVDTDLREMTREGLPVKALPALAGEMSIDLKALAKVVGISDRTLSRRLASGSRLTAEESDRTMRVARVFAMTKDTLGDSEKASRWLQKRNIALGGGVPLDLLDTDAGSKDVETILHRIEYGIYS
jgi:putative toxin-antitoxin system antitoxin component (TIGR02293 family)